MDSPKSVSSTESRSRVAPSIANLSREELERTVQNLVRKLKQRDKELKDSEAKGSAISEGSSHDLKAFEAERQAWREEKGKLQSLHAEASTQRDQALQHVNEVSVQVDQLKEQLLESGEKVKAAEEERMKLVHQLKELQDEDEALREQVGTLKAAIGATIDERDASFARLAEERDRRAEIESLLSTAQHQLRQFQEETASLQKDRNQLESYKEKLAASEKRAEDVLENLRGDIAEQEQRSTERIEEMQHRLRDANERAVLLEQRKDDALAQEKELKKELDSLRERDADRRAACERVTELEKEVALLKTAAEGGEERETVPAEYAKELEERMEKYKENTRQLEDRLTASENTRSEELTQINALQEKLKTLTAELTAEQQLHKENMDKAAKKSSDLEEDAARATAREAEQQSVIEGLQSELASNEEKMARMKERNDSLRQRLQEVHYSTQDHKETTARLEELQKLHEESFREKAALSEELMSLKEMLRSSEENMNALREEQATERENYAEQTKELQTELKKAQKGCYDAEDRLKEVEDEISQLKMALTKSTSKLEEETQAHRIASQRLSDEQETTQHVRQQLHEALSKMQTSEVEAWKRHETLAAQQKEKEDAYLKHQEKLNEEISELKSTIAAHEQQIAAHEDDIEKVREAAEGEKEKLKRAIMELRKRLDRTTAQLKKTELEGAEIQDGYFAEKERLSAEVSLHQHQAEKFTTELKDYKTKAHLLVKNKDQELNTLKAELQHRADVEVDLKVLREQFDDLTMERDNIREELTEANERFQVHMDDLVAGFQAEIDEKTFALLQSQSEKDAVEIAAQEWKTKAEQFETELQQKTQEIAVLSEPKPSISEAAQQEADERCRLLEKELEDVKAEFQSYRQTTEQMSDVQQREMSRLIQSNLELRRNTSEDDGSIHSDRHLSIDQRMPQRDISAQFDNFQLSDLLEGRETGRPFRLEDGESLTESQIVVLANKQAEREDKLHVLKKQNQQMRSEIEDLEKELELHREQERVLKSYLREADQLKKQLADAPPSNLDFPYLKNTVMKLMTTGESEALLPVFAKLLSFTEEEKASLLAAIHGRKKRTTSEDASRSGGLFASLTDWSWT